MTPTAKTIYPGHSKYTISGSKNNSNFESESDLAYGSESDMAYGAESDLAYGAESDLAYGAESEMVCGSESESAYEYKSDKNSNRKININEILSENENTPKINPAGNIIPSNFDQIDPNDKWDSSFGLPLLEKKEQAAYFVKMMDNYKNYKNTLDKFGQYLTDQSTIIKTETTIDPFKPSVRSSQLNEMTVQDIYDEQVAGPQIVQKKIKERTDSGIVYFDESEMNGGKMKGTNLSGFNGVDDRWESAAFGNGF